MSTVSAAQERELQELARDPNIYDKLVNSLGATQRDARGPAC